MAITWDWTIPKKKIKYKGFLLSVHKTARGGYVFFARSNGTPVDDVGGRTMTEAVKNAKSMIDIIKRRK